MLDSESEANIPVGFSSRSQFRPPCYTRRTALHPNSEMLIIGASQFWAVMNAVLPNFAFMTYSTRRFGVIGCAPGFFNGYSRCTHRFDPLRLCILSRSRRASSDRVLELSLDPLIWSAHGEASDARTRTSEVLRVLRFFTLTLDPSVRATNRQRL